MSHTNVLYELFLRKLIRVWFELDSGVTFDQYEQKLNMLDNFYPQYQIFQILFIVLELKHDNRCELIYMCSLHAKNI